MVLNELGQKISAALAKVQNAEVVDDALIDACLKDISTALLQADVNVRQVQFSFSKLLFPQPNLLKLCLCILKACCCVLRGYVHLLRQVERLVPDHF